jgi:hypothetical protein
MRCNAMQITMKNKRSFYPNDAINDGGGQPYKRGERRGGRSKEREMGAACRDGSRGVTDRENRQ